MGWITLLLLLGVVLSPPEPRPAQRPPGPADLERIAAAVEGAESGFGTNRAMWRPKPAGPQGPMQVSAGNWTDAVIAYNWGPGNVDRWLIAGRPLDGVSDAVRQYVERVMRDVIAAPPKALLGSALATAGPSETPIADIKNPVRRKKYLANRTMVAELRGFLAGSGADGAGADAGAIIGLIRRAAARPGYQQFAGLRAARLAAPAAQPALKQIASVLIDKLQSECAAIVAIDHRHGGTAFKGPARC